jgi:diacylglycerol kinase family enzyme
MTVRRATVSTHRPRLWLSIDGELSRLDTPLVFQSLPKALSVLVPRQDDLWTES